MSMSPRLPVDPAEDRLDAPVGSTTTTRRRFVRNVGLGAAALGAVAVTGGALTQMASAQGEAEPPDLDPSDIALVQWLQSLCLAARDGLTTASRATFLQSETKSMVETFARHHRDQAAALGALLPKEAAVTTSNPKLLAELNGRVDGAASESAMLDVLLDFEERLSATMLAAVGDADLFVVAGTIAAAMAVVGQQAAAFGHTAAKPIDSWLPTFATTDGAYTQAAYPVA